MNIKKKLSGFFRLVFPTNLTEILLFSAFLIGYGVLGTCIATQYRIIFDNRIPWDAYFSFDNRAILMTGGGFERHPLSNYFFDLIRNLAKWVSGNRYDADFRLVLAWTSTITVSLSLVQVYKYLKNIVRLPVSVSGMIVVFFAFFATNILLSFTPETYTYTLFLLILFNHYAALKIRNDQKIPSVALTLAAVSIGGLTITNIAKVFIPVFFEKGLICNWKKLLNALFRGLISVVVFLLLYLNRVNFDVQRIFAKTGEQYDKFSKPKVTPLWEMVSSWFWGGNILFPGFVIRDYHNRKGFEYKALFMDVYSAWMPYAFVGLLFGLVLWSYVMNFRNKLVQILMISFSVDILIHVVLKFGLHTSYIYGGHFIFVVPFMLGWLFHHYKNASRMLIGLSSVGLLMSVYLIVNNITRMQEFFVFLEVYYK